MTNRATPSDIVLACHDLCRTYHDGSLKVSVLRGVSLAIAAGEKVAIVGPSGSGKSTLLHLLGGLDKPDAGIVTVDCDAINDLSERKRCQVRNNKLGFVYQFHHLLPEFTALENVAMPLLIRGVAPAAAIKQAQELLTAVGLAERTEHRLSQLSGGERQRTAIARALVNKPKCLLADEPTGNLDHQTAERIFQTLLKMNQDYGTSMLIVTHDLSLAQRMDRILRLEDGVLEEMSTDSLAFFAAST